MSKIGAAAVLTADLLARKGVAVPTGFATNSLMEGSLNVSAPYPTVRTPRPVARDCPSEGEQRARITLRLDRERHLRLRLTAAHLRSNLQTILIDALDRYLDQIGPEVLSNNCVCLAVKSNRQPGQDVKGVESDATNCDS